MKSNHFIVVVSLSAMITLGCRPKDSGRPEESKPQPTSADDSTQRVSDLQRYSVELTALSKNLPGRDPKEDQQLLADAFDRATSALTLLMGPEPHGAFRQQLRIIDMVRNEVRAGSASDAQVDSGIRAIHNALVGVRDRLFGGEGQAKANLNPLSERVGELDNVRGPLHSVAVARALQEASTVIENMTAHLEGPRNRRQPATPTAAPQSSFAAPGDFVQRS